MDSAYRSIDRLASALARFAIRRRWAVIAASVIGALAIGTGAARIEFDNNYRVFFSDQNPELLAFEELQATYTKNDNFLFVLEPADGQVFSAATLAAVEELTERAWQIPYAIRVDSVSNFQHTEGIDDDLIVEDLFANAVDLSPAEIARRAEIALDEPLLANQLVTADGRVTAVNVVLQYPEVSPDEIPEAVAVARAIREQIAAAHPTIRLSLTGVSMLNNAFAEVGIADLGVLVPAMFGVIVILTSLILRSLTGTVATVSVVMLSVIVGMGWAGFVGIGITPISGAAPIIILTLAIADSIHILISLRTASREGLDKHAAIVEALRQNFLPVTITSLTTIIGFLSLNFSDSPPFWHLGNITAVGIVAAWAYSISLLPALVSALPYRVGESARPDPSQRLLARVADFVIARPRAILLGTGLSALALAAFIPTIDFNDQWTQYFDQRVEFRRDTDRATEHFGLYPIEFSVPAQASGGVSDPEYLDNLARFADFLRAQPAVEHVYALSDIMRRLNKNLHGDDPSYYRIPADRELGAQYLLLYELSLPYGLDLNDRINIDKSASRVTATLGAVDSVQTRAFLAAAAEWMKENWPEWMQTSPTSAAVMFTHIARRNVDNMIRGTIIAVSLISLILVVSLRSLRLGLMSLIPNGLPILAAFGAWAIIVGEVGFSVATIASISLGIIVDDTVHLLSKYVRVRSERGVSAPEAIRHAFASVGKAVIVNTAILTAGFVVLLASTFKINVDMGMLTAISIVFALVLDFLFLPALLLLVDRSNPQSQRQGDSEMKDQKVQDVTLQPAGTMASLLLTGAIALGGIALPQDLLADDSVATGDRTTAPADHGGAAAVDGVTAVRGETEAERRGFEIAARADRSDRGFGDSEVELTMVLRNAAGKESTRTLSIATLEMADEAVGDKSLVVFDSPNDIKGTALLSHARILDPDDQWLFLPALERVKRISSANKSGPFVGSEFAFEDFTALELNKYDYVWLREEVVDAMTMDVVERLPRYENSGYTRQVSWIDQDAFQVRRVDFYDRRGDLLKTLELKDYRHYDGVWRAHRMEMINHQTGKSTDLVYSDYSFGTGLDGNDFERGRLTRLR
jgi:predicted RND superfamily exporter protein